jgi:D-alanyl-D-alanine dipeptidase
LINPYADRPVPLLTSHVLPTLGRASVPIDSDDPRAQEKLVDIRTLGVRGDNYYARKDGSNPPFHRSIEGSIAQLFLRESVAARLVQVDAALGRIGLGLYVLDGYRPIATQRGLWRFIWDHFALTEADLTHAEVESKVHRFVSDPRCFDPNDQRTWPLHSTGGAVDLTLCNNAEEILDLGAMIDLSGTSPTSFFEEAVERGDIAENDPRLLNRRTLYWAMRDAGFTNYIYEWWHFDWGDQMHVFTLNLMGDISRPSAAWYGYIDPPSSC